MTIVIESDVSVFRRSAILIAMLGAQIVLGVVNELVDLDSDRLTKPSKPLASGAVGIGGAWRLLAGGVGLMQLGSTPLGWRAWLLCQLGCGIGVAYSLWFKRTRLAWLPYVAALPLLPIWVATAMDAFRARFLWLYPLGALAVIGVQFAQSAPDVEADRRAGIGSMTTRLGERRTLFASWAATAGSALMIGALGRAHPVTALAAIVVLVGVCANVALARMAPTLAVRLAFPIAAGATGLLGVAWVVAAGR